MTRTRESATLADGTTWCPVPQSMTPLKVGRPVLDRLPLSLSLSLVRQLCSKYDPSKWPFLGTGIEAYAYRFDRCIRSTRYDVLHRWRVAFDLHCTSSCLWICHKSCHVLPIPRSFTWPTYARSHEHQRNQLGYFVYAPSTNTPPPSVSDPPTQPSKPSSSPSQIQSSPPHTASSTPSTPSDTTSSGFVTSLQSKATLIVFCTPTHHPNVGPGPIQHRDSFLTKHSDTPTCDDGVWLGRHAVTNVFQHNTP